MSLSNELFSAFHYRPYGTFFLHSKSPTLSKVVLPTTDIIEPKKLAELVFSYLQYYIRKTNRKRVQSELFLAYFALTSKPSATPSAKFSSTMLAQ